MHDNNGRAHCSITIRNKLTRGICKMLQQYTLSGWLWLHSHLLVWLRCLSVRLRGCLHRRVHGRGGIVGSWGVLVPRRKGGVVAQVPTRCSGLGRTSCGRKGNRDEFSLYQRSNPLSSSDYWKKWCPLYYMYLTAVNKVHDNTKHNNALVHLSTCSNFPALWHSVPSLYWRMQLYSFTF